MDRRTLLARCGLGLAGSAALAGCTEETLEAAETKPPFLDHVDEENLELPVEQRLDRVEAGVLAAQAVDGGDLGTFETSLRDQGLAVEELEARERVVEEMLQIETEARDVVVEEPHGERTVLDLSYHQPDLLERGALRGIGVAAGGYAALVAGGLEGAMLSGTVLDAQGEAFGSFHVLSTWATEYDEGAITAREYGAKAWVTAASG